MIIYTFLKITNFPSGFEPQTKMTSNFESVALPIELLGIEGFMFKNWTSDYQKISAQTPNVRSFSASRPVCITRIETAVNDCVR